MAGVKSRWLEAMDWLQAIDRTLPQEWPTELPPESASGFWRVAAEMEMQRRGIVSEQTQAMTEPFGHEKLKVDDLDRSQHRRGQGSL